MASYTPNLTAFVAASEWPATLATTRHLSKSGLSASGGGMFAGAAGSGADFLGWGPGTLQP